MNSTQAKQRLADLTAEATQALADVDTEREAVSAGEATARDVERAQKALAKAEARRDQGAVDLKVAARREQQEAEIAAREADRIRRELDAITRQKATVEAVRYREFLLTTKATMEGFSERLGGYEAQLGFGSINVPGRFKSFGLTLQAIQDQVFRFTRPT